MTTVEVPVRTRKEVLLRAADLLEERGWCQGSVGMPWGISGALCINGAVLEATDVWPVDTAAAYAFAKEMIGGDDYPHIWNDMPGRTAEEVIARLRQAADDA